MSPEMDTDLDESVMLGRKVHLAHHPRTHALCGYVRPPGVGAPPKESAVTCGDCVELREFKRPCVCGWPN